jgi:TetR/AcrR family transcriptional regulator, regulator of cefoperazone and chloramphenicol sensitivity
MARKFKNSQNHKNELTLERILDEAEALFANKGYHAVSVREITRAAHCNLAAVNYHFGNKQNLYLEVFRSRWLPRASRLFRNFKISLKNSGNSSPNAVVQSLVRAFLEGPLSDDERMRHHKLIFGEFAQPTEAFDLVADQVLKPLFSSLMTDLKAVMPDTTGDKQMALNSFSILAMVLYFNLARPLISRFLDGYDEVDFKDRLVDHIVEFSLNGIGAGKEEARK